MKNDSVFIKKLVWKEFNDIEVAADDPFSDGKIHMLTETLQKYELPKSMLVNVLVSADSAPHPPFHTELDYFALIEEDRISYVLAIEESQSEKFNVAVVEFTIENGLIKLGKASFFKNKQWSSYLRNL